MIILFLIIIRARIRLRNVCNFGKAQPVLLNCQKYFHWESGYHNILNVLKFWVYWNHKKNSVLCSPCGYSAAVNALAHSEKQNTEKDKEKCEEWNTLSIFRTCSGNKTKTLASFLQTMLFSSKKENQREYALYPCAAHVDVYKRLFFIKTAQSRAYVLALPHCCWYSWTTTKPDRILGTYFVHTGVKYSQFRLVILTIPDVLWWKPVSEADLILSRIFFQAPQTLCLKGHICF